MPAECVCIPPHDGRVTVQSGSANFGMKQPSAAAIAPPPTHASTETQPHAVNALVSIGSWAPLLPNVILAKPGNEMPYRHPILALSCIGIRIMKFPRATLSMASQGEIPAVTSPVASVREGTHIAMPTHSMEILYVVHVLWDTDVGARSSL